MKKQTLLSIALVFTLTISKAQTIPNNGFENWINSGSYEVPDGWGTMNHTTATSNVFTATKATPGNPGTSYLKLTSKTVGSSVVNGIAVSGQLDTLTLQPISGFPISSRPGSLTGKWQHMIFGSSQGSIQVILTRWDNGISARVQVGSGNVTLSGMAMSWASFGVPITYSDGNNPDTCIIILKASGTNPTDQDYLWVDNLAFFGTVTGIEEQKSFLSELSVFPNPTSESISLNISLKNPQQITIELSDLNGKITLTKDIGKIQNNSKQTVDVSGISKGTYLLKLIGEEATEIRKIIIE